MPPAPAPTVSAPVTVAPWHPLRSPELRHRQLTPVAHLWYTRRQERSASRRKAGRGGRRWGSRSPGQLSSADSGISWTFRFVASYSGLAQEDDVNRRKGHLRNALRDAGQVLLSIPLP